MRKSSLGKRSAASARACADGDAGFEAAEQRDGVAFHADVLRDDGGEDIDVCAGREDGAEVEALGQHADDGGGVSVELERLADDVRIGVSFPLPEVIAEQHDIRCTV